MTAASHRISRRSDFSRTLKRGVRISAHDVVVHLLVTPREWPDAAGRRVDVATTGGPWLGLIVSKAVGSAVTRHQVARRLRSAFAAVAADCPSPETAVVIRALPGAAERSAPDLAEQLRTVFADRRARRLALDTSGAISVGGPR
ncbi:MULTISPECIES: ribonuclease P protein component [unclassified Gordonia (in: high G+C Gram-positive bacteria)]